MSTSNGNQQRANVKSNAQSAGDGAPEDVELSAISKLAGRDPADQATTSESTVHRRWRMPSKVPSVEPSRRHKWEIERRFEQVEETAGQNWGADPDEVYNFMAACGSPAEKRFLLELTEEAGARLERASTAWSRVDGWYLTISAPFHVQRKHGCAVWFRLYPQRPILMPDDLFDRRDARRTPDADPYCRVDFLAVLHIESPVDEKGGDACPWPVVIEIDGKGNHSGGQEIRRDYRRNHKFRKIRVQPYRYTARDVMSSEYDIGMKVLSDM